MSNKKGDPRGNAQDRCVVALLLIDVINDLEFEGADALLEPGLRAADRIAELKRRAKEAGIPVIYVNDNFGKWRSDFKKLVSACIDQGTRGKPIVQRLLPESDDYFVLKPKHSAFHATPLDLLLDFLGVRTLILVGLTVDNCILLTAGDAHMLDYQLVVPEDCVAAESKVRKEHALKILQQTLKARTLPANELDLTSLLHEDAQPSSKSLAEVA